MPQLLGEIMEAVADIADMHIKVPNRAKRRNA